jgi:hypothetical protein
MTQLITVLVKVSQARSDYTAISRTEEEAQLFSLAHKVCYKWNREVHLQMTENKAFQGLFSLPEFSRQKVLEGFPSEEVRCRSRQFSILAQSNKE